MIKWRVYLDGRNMGTVLADNENEAKLVAEDEFDLTDEQSYDLDVVEAIE